jgi:hypothetical protein
MGNKDAHRAFVKFARRAMIDAIRDTYRDYKFEVKKHRLLTQQADIKFELYAMGVPNRQIPIVAVPSRTHKINVRVEKGAA